MAEDASEFSNDPFLLAGAHVLGVLEGAERSAAQRAQLSDADFRAAIEWWEWRLGAMAEATAPFAPTPGIWTAIERRIDAIEAHDTQIDAEPAAIPAAQAAGPAPWSIAAALAGAGMAAAAITLYVSTPAPVLAPVEPRIAQSPAPQLVAQLRDEATQRGLVSRFDTASRQLSLSIAGLEADEGMAPELWVIPEGGAPVSLGFIPQAGDFSRILEDSEAELVRSGATIAVTFEEDTGTRHEAPSPPILLAGALDQV